MENSPRRMRDITPGWLGAVLGFEVAAVEAELIGTFSTQVWRLKLTYAAPDERAPASLVLKRPGKSATVESRSRFVEEVAVYREVLDTLGLRAPRCWFGAADTSGSDGLLLLEDVGEVADLDWLVGASFDHAEHAMDALAHLHAVGEAASTACRWIPDFGDPARRRHEADVFDTSWPVARALFDAVVPAYTPIGDALVGRGAGSLVALGDSPTLLHGDAHFENLPLANDEIVWLDWAGVARGHPAFDVAVFCVMSFPRERRAALEHELIDRHAAGLRARRPGLVDEPFEHYRTAVLAWSMRIVAVAARRIPGEGVHSPGLKMIAQRAAAAAVDLATGDCIR